MSISIRDLISQLYAYSFRDYIRPGFIRDLTWSWRQLGPGDSLEVEADSVCESTLPLRESACTSQTCVTSQLSWHCKRVGWGRLPACAAVLSCQDHIIHEQVDVRHLKTPYFQGIYIAGLVKANPLGTS